MIFFNLFQCHWRCQDTKIPQVSLNVSMELSDKKSFPPFSPSSCVSSSRLSLYSFVSHSMLPPWWWRQKKNGKKKKKEKSEKRKHRKLLGGFSHPIFFSFLFSAVTAAVDSLNSRTNVILSFSEIFIRVEAFKRSRDRQTEEKSHNFSDFSFSPLSFGFFLLQFASSPRTHSHSGAKRRSKGHRDSLRNIMPS